MGGQEAESAAVGDEVAIVLPETHFYVESGGQVADSGTIVSVSEPRWEIGVREARQPVGGLIVHLGRVLRGQPRRGDVALASVDEGRRWDIMRNHTATHLLHASLRLVLGDHARQAGSLVAPDRLRFDFNHTQAMSKGELERVQALVNQAVLTNYELDIRERPRDEAIGEGAMALFGETYGETVRTITIGDVRRFSYELCGGTHVPETGVIGPFLILSEGSVAAGVRRIEAVTGRAALALIQDERSMLTSSGGAIGHRRRQPGQPGGNTARGTRSAGPPGGATAATPGGRPLRRPAAGRGARRACADRPGPRTRAPIRCVNWSTGFAMSTPAA